MTKKDTIMIFQQPELYFFPFYKDLVFAPFGIPEKSFRYLLYKGLYLLRIPLYTRFWGDWKNHLKEAGQVIIFDYGYQRGMETYIHKVNPDCKVSLFFWNIVNARQKNHKLFTDKSAIYSTDKGDCKTYGFRYQHMFYPREFYTPYNPDCGNRLFFIGQDKGRGPYILSLKKALEQAGIVCDIRLLSKSKGAAYRNSLRTILTDRSIPYEEYCRILSGCGILLDINQEGQTALTMRVMESVFFSKKLITNNQDIRSYPFYEENNIFLLPDDRTLPDPKDLARFLEAPFVPYSSEVLDSLSFQHWKDGFAR